ncbi:MAG: YicC family protein [Succinatimonas sp.]|jgi:uncharacterized protein (TIGR00255 family)|nr:YicC family protein [Succinatimonas sp.]MDD5869268.1 YicC family protein [Succinatimonas sp.]MDY5721831.1 YicC/YloC family endoribonuclease [Succinivibrio sp.]
MANIKSMTGSASIADNNKIANLNIDISSVNSRYLEIFLKIPDNLRHLDSQLRALIQSKLSRGKLDCFINYNLNLDESLNINQKTLDALTKALSTIKDSLPNSSINALEILNYPGVLKQEEHLQEKVDELILKDFEKALDELVKTRQSEGSKLKEALLTRLDLVSKQTDIVEKSLKVLVVNERQRLKDKIANFGVDVDPQRIEQEVALAAQRSDVEEEYDRLRAHIKEVKAILDKGGICGKRLDFMMQEFNRETNTLASKAATLDITQVAIELKVLIEQMREQVQNIE